MIAAIVTMIAAVVWPGGWSPAEALRCLSHPDASPKAVLDGTARLSTNEPFFDRYAYAVIGTVHAIETDDDGATQSYGRTSVWLEVEAAFNADSVPQVLEVTSPDPGWHQGYPFEVATTYFIPIGHRSPQRTTDSFLCDPISPVTNPDWEVARLARVADNSGVPVALEADGEGMLLAGVDSEPRVEPLVERRGSPVVRYTFFGLAFGGIVFIGALGLSRRRSRCRGRESS